MNQPGEITALYCKLLQADVLESNSNRIINQKNIYDTQEPIISKEQWEFVQKIIVHAPDKSSGHRRQKVQIMTLPNMKNMMTKKEHQQTSENVC